MNYSHYGARDTPQDLTYLIAGSLDFLTPLTQLKSSFYSCFLFRLYRERHWVTDTLSHLARATQLGVPAAHFSPDTVLFVANLSLSLRLSISQNRRKIRETRPARGWSDTWRESKDWVLWGKKIRDQRLLSLQLLQEEEPSTELPANVSYQVIFKMNLWASDHW